MKNIFNAISFVCSFVMGFVTNMKFLMKVRSYIKPYCSGFKFYYSSEKGLTVAFIMDSHIQHKVMNADYGTLHNHVVFGFNIHPKLGTQLYLGNDLTQSLNGKINRLENRHKHFSLGFVEGNEYAPLWIFNASVIGNALHDFLLSGGRIVNEESIRHCDSNYEVHDAIYAGFFQNALVMDL